MFLTVVINKSFFKISIGWLLLFGEMRVLKSKNKLNESFYRLLSFEVRHQIQI